MPYIADTFNDGKKTKMTKAEYDEIYQQMIETLKGLPPVDFEWNWNFGDWYPKIDSDTTVDEFVLNV